jgi:photosystem II stability/assembly factor-like uncharacterized protein
MNRTPRIRRLGVLFFILLNSFIGAMAVFAQQIPPELLQGLSWRLIGPYRGGRVTAVAGISGDPKTYYMGTPGGGVWKTTNAGSTWQPIFDEAHVASIGDVAVALSDRKIIYVGTGEQTAGNGVWRSVDEGKSWRNVGLAKSRFISTVLVDPHNANVVYVAARGELKSGEWRGIFKSTDGGGSWRKMFYKEDYTPIELSFDPDNSRSLLGVMQHLPPEPGEKPSETPDFLILASSDAGETWKPLNAKGLPAQHQGRIGVAIAAHLSGKRIFAVMHHGLFRSDDAGSSWQQITKDPRIVGSDYFSRVYCDPNDPEVVYVVQTSTYRSSDGGRTFSAWKGTPSGEDDHVLWIAHDDSRRVVMGTDQGATITFDGGTSWSTWYNQPTGQFYRVSTDNVFPYRIYAAQQDSGSVVVPSRSDFGLITYRDWFSSGSFESSFIAPDPLHPDFIYSFGWYGNVIRLNRRTGQIATLFIPPPNYRTAWETPILFSPRDPHTIFFGAQFVVKSTDGGLNWKEISPDLTLKPNDIQEPQKSSGGGHVPSNRNMESLRDDEFGEPQPQAADRGFIQTIAPSPLDPNLIWVGTSTGLVQLTQDATTWSNVTPAGLPEHSTINSIEASAHDAAIAFVCAFAPARRAIGAPQNTHAEIYRTRDFGKSWEKVANGLPQDEIARVVREDPVRKGMLFAGTESGVYLSLDAGDHWQPLQLNLPAASVRDLAIHGADLVAATFGRGLWILDDISALRQVGAARAGGDVHFFVPQDAIRVRWDNDPDTPLQPDTPAAQNPPDGAVLYYSLDSDAKREITLDVRTEQGALIQHFSSIPSTESLPPANVPEFWFYPSIKVPTAKGLNRFVWDLRYRHPTALPYGFFGERLDYIEYTLPDHAVPGATPRFQPPGPLVSPGTYDLVLTVEGKSYRQKLRVLPDPRVHMAATDYDAQFELSRKLCDLMEASAAAFRSVSRLHEQLDERKKNLSSDTSKEISEAFAKAGKQIEELESGTAEAPGFGTLNRNVGRYLVMVQAADIAPTESARRAYVVSCEAYNKEVAALHAFNAEKASELNKLLPQKMAPLAAVTAPSVMNSCNP